MTPEGIIKKQICDWLAYQRKDIFFWINSSVGIYDPGRGMFRRPNSPYQIKGTADILGCYKGRIIAIEVKSKRGTLSIEQRQFLERISSMGGLGIIARSIEDVQKALERYDEILKSERNPNDNLNIDQEKQKKP
jgi:penicillin-binding protein-related factor A (putative recombinase)